MSYITLILEVLRAIPQVLKLLSTMWESISTWKESQLIEETKKAAKDGDTKTVETNLGSPRAGEPSGNPDSILRPKKRD